MKEVDRQFIDRIREIDDAKIQEGGLPPRHLLALLRTDQVGSKTVVGGIGLDDEGDDSAE